MRFERARDHRVLEGIRRIKSRDANGQPLPQSQMSRFPRHLIIQFDHPLGDSGDGPFLRAGG